MYFREVNHMSIFALLNFKFKLQLDLLFEIRAYQGMVTVFLLLKILFEAVLCSFPIFLNCLNVFYTFKILFMAVASVRSLQFK